MNGSDELRSEIRDMIIRFEDLEMLSYEQSVLSKLRLLHDLHELPYGSLSADHRRNLLTSIQMELQSLLPSCISIVTDSFSTEILYLMIDDNVVAELSLMSRLISFRRLEQSISNCKSQISRCHARLHKFRPMRLQQLMSDGSITKIQEAINDCEHQIDLNQRRLTTLYRYQHQVSSLVPTLEKEGFICQSCINKKMPKF